MKSSLTLRIGLLLASTMSAWALVLNPAPMVTTEPSLDSLLQYQIFGADSVVGGSNLVLNNSKGYFGSNVKVVANNGQWKIAPTTVVGGNGSGLLHAQDGGEFDGTVVVEGAITLGNSNTFTDTIASYSAPTGGSLTATGKTYYNVGLWPAYLQTLQHDHSIPALDTSKCQQDDPSFPRWGSISVNPSNLNTLPNTYLIDISHLTDTVVDYCVNNIGGNDNGYKVLIKHQPWQLFRMFVNGNLTFHNAFAFGETQDGTTLESSDQYQGSIMVYLNGSGNILGSDVSALMGTFISRAPVSLWQGISLTGQIVAQSITIQNNLDGQHFRYVPFNPPVVQPTLSINGNTPLTENNTAVRTISVTLDKPAIVPVTLDYSFVWGAAQAPVPPDTTNADTSDFAVGSVFSGSLSIPIGATSASFTVQTRDKHIVGGARAFNISLGNISGAVFPGDVSSINVPMIILDNDAYPPPTSRDSSITLLENTSYKFAQTNFPYVGSYALGNIVIKSLPAKGTLWYDVNHDGVMQAAEAAIVNQQVPAAFIPYLYFTPSANTSGTPYTTFTYEVTDVNGETSSAPNTMTVNVTWVNQAPSFTVGPNETVLEDAGLQTYTTWATAISQGAGDPAQTLTFKIVSNSNAALFSAVPAITSAGTLTFTTAQDANGVDTVKVQLQDNGGTANGGKNTSATQTFVINVTPVNDAPLFTVTKPNDTVVENAGAQTVNPWATAIKPGPATATDEASQTLAFTVTAANPSLFSVQPKISSAGVLTFTPAADSNGTTLVHVVLRDGGLTANGGIDTAVMNFTIVILPKNNAPSFTPGGDQTVLEDAGAKTVTNWATNISKGPANESLQILGFRVTNNDSALFSAQPAISPTGTLTYTPAANANGSATVTVRLGDNGGTANGGADSSTIVTFTILVTAVNDAPSFTGQNITVPEDAGSVTVANWAQNVSMGPANESTQGVSAYEIVSDDNTALFSAAGLPAIATNGTLTFTTGTYAYGVAHIGVRLKDNGGTANGGVDTSAIVSFTITVTHVNHAPIAVNDNATTKEDSVITISQAFLLSNDIDVDSDPLSVIGTLNASNVTVSLPVAGVYTITPALHYSGPASFQYVISDGMGGLDTGTVTIGVNYVNTAPTSMTISNKTVNQDATLLDTAKGVDPDVGTHGDTLTYTLITKPTSANGASMKIDPLKGIITWVPHNADVSASAYTVKVRATDRFGMSIDQTFTVLVKNIDDAPTMDSIPSQQVSQGSVFALTPRAHDVDSSVVAEGEVWSLVAPPAGMTINASTGAISWTPSNSNVGVDSITVKVTDDSLKSATRTFALTVVNVNDKPTLAAIPNDSVNQNATLSVHAIGHDIDSAVVSAHEADIYSLVSAPAGMIIDSTTGWISWTPGNSDVGVHPVTVQIKDDSGSVAQQSFSVTVKNINDPPVIAAIANDSVQQNVAYSYQATATDPDLSVDPLEVLKFSLLHAPAGMSIDSLGGKISFVPQNADVGLHAITVVVKDRLGLVDSTSYTLKVINTNDAPIMDSIPNLSVKQDSLFTYTPVSHDIDSSVAPETETWSLVSAPAGLTIDSTTGTMSWTPTTMSDVGNHTVVVQVTDAGGLTAARTFILDVIHVNHAPVLNSTTFAVMETAPMGTVVGTVSGSDPDGDIISYFQAGSGTDFTVGVTGTITLSDSLNYAKAPVESLYVAVTDGVLNDTALVVLSVTHVPQSSVVKIIQVAAGDSVWSNVDTVWTNDSIVNVTWTQDGQTVSGASDVHNGVNVITKTYQGPDKDYPGTASVVALVNKQKPAVNILLPLPTPVTTTNTVVDDPSKPSAIDSFPATTPSGDTIHYINSSQQTLFARVVEVGKDMKLDTLIVKIAPTLNPGLDTVSYVWTDPYGNIDTGKVIVFLDVTPPVVKILSPKDSSQTTKFVVPVVWTVDGHVMDTLTMQSLSVGWNTVIRGYSDRSGNTSYDTVYIKLNDANKDISITLEQPLVLQNSSKVSQYYSTNPPKDGEFFALSLVNTQTGAEQTLQYGIGSKVEPGDSSEPYSDHPGQHLGPTLRVEVKLPQMGGVDAAGNPRGGDLQSIMQANGEISLKAGSGADSQSVNVYDYISGHCLAGAFDSVLTSELLSASLYKAKVSIDVYIYDILGNFVDHLTILQNVNNAKYLNDGGVLTAFLELKPNADGKLFNQQGREYGTGAYVIGGTAKSVSILQCDLPGQSMGQQITYGSNLLKKFGYRRDK